MTQQTPLKIGVAGAGVMGRNHARVLSELRDVELTTVFDPDAVTAEGVAAAYGATAVTTAQAFVAAGLDAAGPHFETGFTRRGATVPKPNGRYEHNALQGAACFQDQR